MARYPANQNRISSTSLVVKGLHDIVCVGTCPVTVSSVCLMSVSGSDVVILNSLLGDRLVISKTDDFIQSYETQSAGTSEGQSYVTVAVSK